MCSGETMQQLGLQHVLFAPFHTAICLTSSLSPPVLWSAWPYLEWAFLFSDLFQKTPSLLRKKPFLPHRGTTCCLDLSYCFVFCLTRQDMNSSSSSLSSNNSPPTLEEFWKVLTKVLLSVCVWGVRDLFWECPAWSCHVSSTGENWLQFSLHREHLYLSVQQMGTCVMATTRGKSQLLRQRCYV